LWTAEINRDREKRTEPWTLQEMCFFWPEDDDGGSPSGPPAEAGSAAVALLALGLFPAWALGFIDHLLKAGEDQPTPARLALLAEDALLLAPVEAGGLTQRGGWGGLMIAEDTAAGELRQFSSEDQTVTVWLRVPQPSEPGSAIWAEAVACLPIQLPPDSNC
jgi:hypothetical protein